ncbi:MAG TPA: hypothetical protein DFI00_00505 [Rhodospirillaceae bacterium]|nr:hypothetical protein [Alphaproteobacteria bacterium]HCI45752.1 hypothetical protein [Rhodospirillaceae bacterium]
MRCGQTVVMAPIPAFLRNVKKIEKSAFLPLTCLSQGPIHLLVAADNATAHNDKNFQIVFSLIQS